jgi:integrating conjugative element protein (TIGR03755 family)
MKIKNTIYTLIITIATLFTINNAYAEFTIKNNYTNEESPFFDTNSSLFYKIGGANTVRQPLTPKTNVVLGFDASVDIGYSCGKFDIKKAFSNLMNNFKNGVDDAVNSVVGTINAGITALPALGIQRAMPGVYDMFQEYKIDAETEIGIANKSCEEMEAQIAQGENPYAEFFQTSKAEIWQEEAEKGTTITDAKKKSEKSAGSNGITDFGEKVGGNNQPSLKVVERAVVAGYNYALGKSNNPTISSNAPVNTELGQMFASSDEAAIWATDVIGEFEINNKVPITKVGTGLHPKIQQEQEFAMLQFNEAKYNELGLGPSVINKIRFLHVKDRNSVYSNLIDDIAIERTIKKGLIIRRLLLSGNQGEASEQRDKKIALLERDIESLMFERRINQELANNTILDILKIKSIEGNIDGLKEPDSMPFF